MTFRKISLAQWSRNLTKLNGVYPFTAKLSLTSASESFLRGKRQSNYMVGRLGGRSPFTSKELRCGWHVPDADHADSASKTRPVRQDVIE